jgi:trans-2,3-dihydro-3-hydroxyanthranilate isomerase
MSSYRFLQLDVFTKRAFTGNQLAVFPDAVGLDTHVMQQIAREMNFSETAFVFPPETQDTHTRVRIFTPRAEIPMAGHPTIGTAFALAHLKRIPWVQKSITFGLGIGPTFVRLEWNGLNLHFAWMTQPVPRFGQIVRSVADLAASIGVRETDIVDTGLPVQVGSSGNPFLFVPILSRAAVDTASLEEGAFRHFSERAGVEKNVGVFIFSLEADNDAATAYSRMFAPAWGIPEDPASGSAVGPLGGYLVRHGAVSPEQASQMITIQGVKMGRPSEIHSSIATQNGIVSGVFVGGQAVLVAEGELHV